MSSREYRADIDGLRALAVSAVVIYHAVPGLLPAGFVGVDIFFVISGYLIGGIIYSGIIDGRFTFADFYARRVKRILPALIVVITMTILAGLFLLDSEQFKVLSNQSIAALIGASNFYFWEHTDYFHAASELQPLLMTWSLGVEEQFYVIFPFVIIAISRLPRAYRAATMAALTAASFLFMLWSSAVNPIATFYLLPSRAWELGIGATLAMLKIDGTTLPVRQKICDVAAGLGTVCVIGSILIFNDGTEFPVAPIALSVIGTAVLISTQSSWINRNILSIRAVVFVGLISYSWYLWHWPIMAYFRIVSDEAPSQMALLAAVPLSFIIAVLSWRFVEQPFRTPRSSSSRALLIGGGALAAAMVVPAIGHLSQGLPERLSPEVRMAEEIRREGRGNCLRGFKDAVPAQSKRCSPEGARIALLGDSHASALGTGLAAFAEQHGTTLVQHTKSSCGPYLGYSYSTKADPESIKTCGAYFEAAVDLVLKDPAIEVIVVASYWPKDGSNPAHRLDGHSPGARVAVGEIVEDGITNLLSKAAAADKTVILVQDVPVFDVDTMSRFIGDGLPARRTLRTWVSADHTIVDAPNPRIMVDTETTRVEETLRRLARSFPNTLYFRVRDQFCVKGSCLYMSDGKPLFFDRHHLSTYGSNYVDWNAVFAHSALDDRATFDRDRPNPP